jgi:hypothetical protein
MPNFDGGHYFLTVLAPVRTDTVTPPDGTPESCELALRRELACLPTALQSRASAPTGLNSPFARNKRTHFVRFSVINDVIYNGRDPSDAILNAIDKTNPIIPQPVDRLTTPFLLLSIDFDAAGGADSVRDDYLSELWSEMSAELTAVFQYCIGFDGVKDGASFAAYIAKCQVETTMPFNDYWITPPPLPVWNVKPWLWGIGIAAAVFLISLLIVVCGLFGGDVAAWSISAILPSWLSWGGLSLIGLAATVLLIWLTYKSVMAAGYKPFPTAPNSDLKSVLKAVYLQQRFVEFAIDHQGKDAAALHAGFGAFLERNKPSNLDEPTQTPGVISTPRGVSK